MERGLQVHVKRVPEQKRLGPRPNGIQLHEKLGLRRWGCAGSMFRRLCPYRFNNAFVFFLFIRRSEGSPFCSFVTFIHRVAFIIQHLFEASKTQWLMPSARRQKKTIKIAEDKSETHRIFSSSAVAQIGNVLSLPCAAYPRLLLSSSCDFVLLLQSGCIIVNVSEGLREFESVWGDGRRMLNCED